MVETIQVRLRNRSEIENDVKTYCNISLSLEFDQLLYIPILCVIMARPNIFLSLGIVCIITVTVYRLTAATDSHLTTLIIFFLILAFETVLWECFMSLSPWLPPVLLHNSVYCTTWVLYITMKILFVSQVTANALLVRRTRECWRICQHLMDRQFLRVLIPPMVSAQSIQIHLCNLLTATVCTHFSFKHTHCFKICPYLP